MNPRYEVLQTTFKIQLCLIFIGLVGSSWMTYSLARKLRLQYHVSTENAILYKLLLLVAVTEIFGALCFGAYKMYLLLHEPLYPHFDSYDRHVYDQSNILFYFSQISFVALLACILGEGALVLQVFLVAKYNTAVHLNIRWTCWTIVIFSLARCTFVFIPQSKPTKVFAAAMTYVDIPLVGTAGSLIMIAVIYLIYQSRYGNLLRYQRQLIRRMMLFPLSYFFCLLPKLILHLVMNIQGTKKHRSHPVHAAVDSLTFAYFLCHSLSYCVIQRLASKEQQYQKDYCLNLLLIIDPKQLQIDWKNELGRGAFGVVYKGVYRGTDVAAKVMPLPCHFANRKHQSFFWEAATLNRLIHPNIVYFMGAFVDQEHGYIVCEYCNSGSLHHVLQYFRKSQTPRNFMLDKWKIKIALGLAQGLNYLHQMNIIHRDLKSPNVLVADCITAKVADFGTAKLVSSLAGNSNVSHVNEDNVYRVGENQLYTTRIGTLPWVAPEILSNYASGKGAYGPAVDIYSFGIILWELLTLQMPFGSITSKAKMQRMLISGERPTMEEVPLVELEYLALLQRDFIALLRKCWHQDPAQRPDTIEIIDSLQSQLHQFKRQERIHEYPVRFSKRMGSISFDGSSTLPRFSSSK